jgi:hypothetical protein
LWLIVKRLLAPLDEVTRWAVAVLKAIESWLLLRQRPQQLSLL